MVKDLTQKNLTLLLSGRHPQSKKYAGRHVLVIEDKIIPLREGEKGVKDLEKLEKKYGKPPVLTFVPRLDISYILIGK